MRSAPSSLPPELALIVACSKRPISQQNEAAGASPGPPIDEDRFLALIARHRVAALVHEGVTSAGIALSPATRERLKTSAVRDRVASLSLSATLLRTCELLKAAGIAPLSIKGPSLAVLAFNDLTLRYSSDLDILVAPDQVEHALATMLTADYVLIEHQEVHQAGNLDQLIPYRKDVTLHHQPSGARVELHWRLSSNRHMFPPSLIEPRRDVSLGAGTVTTLDEHALLVYLCVHGARHLWFRLKWVADVQALLQQYPGGAPAFLERARASGLRVPAEQMLLLLGRLYGSDHGLPTGHRPRWRARIAACLAWQVLCEPDEPDHLRFATTKILASHFLLRSEPRYLWREAVELAVDWPVVLAGGGSRWSWIRAVAGRPLYWLQRKLSRRAEPR